MAKLRQIDPRLLTILLIVLVQMLGSAMILPILPLYAQNEFEMSPQIITLLSTIFFAAQFIAGPYLGNLSDRVGRVPVLIISQIGTAISFVMLAFAPNPLVLFLARLLDGITGGNIVVAQAYVTDITSEERRTESLGYIFAAFGIGFIIGPALGGILSAAYGLRAPYLLAAVAASITIVLTQVLLNETITDKNKATSAARNRKRSNISWRQIFRNPALLVILAIAFMNNFAVGILQAVFALFGEEVLFAGRESSEIQIGIGIILTVVGVGQVFTQIVLIRPLLARLHEVRLISLAIVLRSVSMVFFIFWPTPFGSAIAGIFYAIGTGLLIPPLQALTTRTADETMRGEILGVFQSASTLGIIISTAIAGVLYAISPFMPFWVSGGFLLLLLPTTRLLRKPDDQMEVMPSN